MEITKKEFLERFGLVNIKLNSFYDKRFNFNSIDDEPHVAISVHFDVGINLYVDDIHHVKDIDSFSGMATDGDEVFYFYEVD